ncbi:MAG: SRPBCC family protein [Candidatus Limnocylindria bacterium]
MAAKGDVAATERTLVVTRFFDAPRELVFKAWTDKEQLALWFPPADFTAPVIEVDPRPGGVFRVVMKGPEGEPFNGAEFPGEGLFTEVVPNERLAFTFAGEGDNAPPPILMTVVFEDEGDKTKVTVQQTAETVEDYEALETLGSREGLGQSFEKLDELLARLQGTTP